jgi:hypothetical protein
MHMIEQTKTLEPAQPIAAQFSTLVEEWKAACGPTSSVVRMAKIPAYQKIIALGEAAIPLLLAELEREPDHWFIALHAITGADPKESCGRLKDMTTAWLRWGKLHGFTQ